MPSPGGNSQNEVLEQEGRFARPCPTPKRSAGLPIAFHVQISFSFRAISMTGTVISPGE
jgi:hypothetical protein